MESLYFPKELYIDAMEDYLTKTQYPPQVVQDYCIADNAFFVELVFAYVDKLPYPKMKGKI
jgi:hypothetical protein